MAEHLLDEFDKPALPPPAAILEPQPFEWKGKPLASYSFARRLMYRGIYGQDDAPPDEGFAPALLFVLSLTEEEARAKFYRMPALRAEFWEWMKGQGTNEYPAMVTLADTILKEAKKGDVRAVQDGAADPLKKNP